MSAYVERSVLRSVKDDKDWWKTTYRPGELVPVSGIYRCDGCGREDACNEDDPFPPQNHRQHATSEGGVRWRLNIRAEKTPV
jgi:hypothetical protein